MKTLRFIIVACTVSFACKDDPVSRPPTDESISAAAKLSAVNSLASSFGAHLQLMRVHADNVSIDGHSELWCYDYLDASSLPPVIRCYHATNTQVVFDSTSALPLGFAVITHHWFDSDSALYFAEQNGGSAFRNQHPHCEIEASLGEDLTATPFTSWWVVYRSDKTNVLMLEIDANTGALITKLQSPSLSTFGSAG